MKPRISLITLGVDDLERSLRFYRDGLGLSTEGIVGEQFENGAVAFFNLQPGLKLAVWPRKSLAKDSGLPLGVASGTEISLAHNVSSRAEVDEVMAQAKAAGAVIVKPAQDTFWGGYAGYFQDPDGHLWEVAWNPEMLPGETVTIYGIKNCDTMKKAFTWLNVQGVDFTFHDYRVEGITRAEVAAWVAEAGLDKVLNKASKTFRALPEAARNGLDKARAIDLMVAEPTMIKRPVLTTPQGIEVGFKPERYATIFGR